jgi:hypothetical protein
MRSLKMSFNLKDALEQIKRMINHRGGSTDKVKVENAKAREEYVRRWPGANKRR